MQKINKFFEYGNKSPKELVVFLHGYGSNGEDLMELAKNFDKTLPNAYFVSPNAPMPLMHPFLPAYQWFELENRDPKVMYPQVIESNNILDEFLQIQLKRFNLSRKNLILVGFSQGAMMSVYNSLRNKDEAKAVVSFSGRLILPEDLGEKIHSTPNICLIHGNQDEVVPFNHFNEAKEYLAKMNFNFEHHEINGLGHSIDYEALQKAQNFLGKFND